MKDKIVTYSLRVLALLWGLIILFPLFWVLYESLKTNREFFADIWAFPEKLQFSNYVRAWNKLQVGTSLWNTVIYVGGGMCLGIIVNTMCAYAFTRLKWKGRKKIWAIVMFSLFLPGINILVPQYTIMRSLGLLNSLGGLIILAALPLSAFDVMLLGGFMSNIPNELEESAIIDGASLFQVFGKIILPLSVPGIVTIGIFKFNGLYNDFIGPLIMLSDSEKWTISINMYNANAMMQYKADWVALLAGMVLTMIPPVVLYIIFQKRIVDGATLGAVKG